MFEEDREAGLEEIVKASVRHCENITDIAHSLQPFIDPSVVEEEDLNELLEIAVQQAAQISGLPYDQAKAALIKELSDLEQQH